MYLRVRDGRVDDVRLRIYEPPRFFEALLRGRGFREPPDITARICGICPVAYQMSACAAIEDACGVEVGEPIRALRRLMYCGEWIESHALHVFMLHAPDFLGYDSAIAMARDHRGVVERGLEIKKAGNALIRVVGGREIHPVNVRVGGFYRAPRRRELATLVEPLERARKLALETVAWTGGLDVPDFEPEHELVALSDPDRYPLEGGRLVSTGGLDIAPGEYEEHFVEEQVAHSTALHSRLRERGAYLVRAAGALRPQRRQALAARARGGGRRRPRTGLPQPVPQHRGPRRRDPLRARRGAADHRRLRGAGPPGGRGAPTSGHRLRVDRGAARDALAPLPARRRRHDRRGQDRAAHLAEPELDRGRPAGLPLRSPGARGRSPAPCASRRSATTTPASPAPRTSSTSRSTGNDGRPPGRRTGQRVARRRRGGAGRRASAGRRPLRPAQAGGGPPRSRGGPGPRRSVGAPPGPHPAQLKATPATRRASTHASVPDQASARSAATAGSRGDLRRGGRLLRGPCPLEPRSAGRR